MLQHASNYKQYVALKNLVYILRCTIQYFTFSHYPKWSFIFFTRNCNLNCPYCKTAAEGSKRDISLSDWKRVIDKLKQFGVLIVSISGGEPLMREDIYELIKYIKTKRMLPFMHSNFSFITTYSIDRLADAGLLALYASIDSKEDFGKLCNPTIIKHLQYASRKGIIPLISSVVTAKNIEEIYDLAQFVTHQDMLFCPGLYQPIGGVYSKCDNNLIPQSDSLRRFSNKMIALKKKTGRIILSYKFLTDIANYPSGWKCSPDDDYWLTVNNDGTLMPCQEYTTRIPIWDIEDLSDPAWRNHKSQIVNSCLGCYHHCYYQQDLLWGIKLIKEYKTLINALKLLSRKFA